MTSINHLHDVVFDYIEDGKAHQLLPDFMQVVNELYDCYRTKEQALAPVVSRLSSLAFEP
jgi:hypothetical protein